MKKLLAILLSAALLLSLAACGGSATQETEAPTQAAVMDISGRYGLDTVRNEAIVSDVTAAAQADKGNALVFYQIFVGSFSDSNGDGVGDLRGIINRFDYLNDGNPDSGLSLGVEGIWLSPIFTSPSYHKYDVADYYEIDPQFGTMEDLQELVNLCHERGVKLILDLVINHTSTRHPWFQEFINAHRTGDTANEYYDFYTWSEGPVEGKTMIPIGTSGHYYEGNFSSQMPEPDYENPAVRQAMVDVAKFYLDMGIDGFRFDAAKYIYFGETTPNTDFWDWYMAQLRAIKPDVYTVAEVWDSDGITIPYFSSTNCFNFTMSQVSGQIAQTAQAGDVNVFTAYVDQYLDQIKAQNPEAMIVPFIANHDTDRAAGFLTVASGQAKVAANLNILMPGSPFIYYGEEIGLKGARGGANTDANRRLAMNWGDGDTVSDPEGADYGSGQTNGTVAEQLANGDSLYNHYKKLIMIRNACPEIACGDYTALVIEGMKLGGFVSTWEGSSVLVLHNTSKSAVTVDLAQITDLSPAGIVAFAGVGGATLEGTVLTVDGQTSVVLR